MAKCPKCGVTLLEDSGLVTCHSCGAMVIIDEDGNPLFDSGERTGAIPNRAESAPLDPLEYLSGLDQQRSDPSPETATVSTIESAPVTASLPRANAFEPAEVHPDIFETPDALSSDFGAQGAQSANSADVAPNPESHAFPMNSDFAEMDGYESPEQNQMEDPSAAQEANDPGAFQMPDLFDSPTDNSNSMLSEEDPLGLNAFANSEVSAAADGMLMCRILIDGIDTKEIRATLRAAMDDQRFNWDQNEILSHLKSGHLVIENITPIKAMVLIKRIKQMPVKIRWEQYTIAEVEDESIANAPDYEAN